MRECFRLLVISRFPPLGLVDDAHVQPQMVTIFKMPAMPFMMFHGPEMVHRLLMTAPSQAPYENTWKSRKTASQMLIARMSGGKQSAHFFS